MTRKSFFAMVAGLFGFAEAPAAEPQATSETVECGKAGVNCGFGVNNPTAPFVLDSNGKWGPAKWGPAPIGKGDFASSTLYVENGQCPVCKTKATNPRPAASARPFLARCERCSCGFWYNI